MLLLRAAAQSPVSIGLPVDPSDTRLRGTFTNFFRANAALLNAIVTNRATLDVRSFGALGDGATDDTAAFQSAILAAESQKAALQVSPGDYCLTQVTIRGPLIMEGRGARLKLIGTDYAVMISPGATNVLLSNLDLDGLDAAPRGINAGTNSQMLLHGVTVRNLRESVGTPDGVYALVIRSGSDAVVEDCRFLNIRTSVANGSGDAPGSARAILFTGQSSQDEPPIRRGLVHGCFFSGMPDTEDSDAIVVLNGTNWARASSGGVTVDNCTFLDIGKRAFKAGGANWRFTGNVMTNTFAYPPNFGAAALSAYARRGYAAGNTFLLGPSYSAMDIGAGTGYDASDTVVEGNIFRNLGGFYTNGISLLIDGTDLTNLVIRANVIATGHGQGIGLRYGGNNIRILDNVIENPIGSAGNYGSGIFLGASYSGIRYDPARDVEVRGNLFANWSVSGSCYGTLQGIWVDNRQRNTPFDLYFAAETFPGGPSSTNGVTVTNLLQTRVWRWDEMRFDEWDGYAWTRSPRVSTTRISGTTSNQWYRVASLRIPTNLTTFPRGGARLRVSHLGGNANPSTTELLIDPTYSGIAQLSLVRNTPSDVSLWSAARYVSEVLGPSNGVAYVDLLAHVTSGGSVICEVEGDPSLYPTAPGYRWQATNVLVSASVDAPLFVASSLTNLHWMASASGRYYGFEDYGIGPLWMLPRWTTAQRDAFPHFRSGAFGWNSDVSKAQFHDGAVWRSPQWEKDPLILTNSAVPTVGTGEAALYVISTGGVQKLVVRWSNGATNVIASSP